MIDAGADVVFGNGPHVPRAVEVYKRRPIFDSLGNFFTIREVLALFHPQAIRFFLLSTHYRGPINYSDATLREATRRVNAIYSTLARMDAYLAERADNHKKGPVHDAALVDGILPEFRAAMDDDFNTPRAIAALSEPLSRANELLDGKEKGGRYATIRALRDAIVEVSAVLRVFHRPPDEVLGEIQARLRAERGGDASAGEAQIAERAAAREARDFARADSLRAALLAQGIQLMDRPGGTDWRLVP